MHIDAHEGVGHNPKQLKPENIAVAFQFLDAPLINASLGAYEDAQTDLKRGRLEDALEKFDQASLYLKLSSEPKHIALFEDATKQTADLERKYVEAVAAVEDAIAAKDDKAATEALREIQRSWRDRLGREGANDYRKQILEIKRAG